MLNDIRGMIDKSEVKVLNGVEKAFASKQACN